MSASHTPPPRAGRVPRDGSGLVLSAEPALPLATEDPVRRAALSDLTRPQLRQLVAELAAEQERWRALVRHDRDRRVFECVLDEPAVEAWLICWMPGHDTGFHDHDVSSGAVNVIEGEVCEDRLNAATPMTTAVYGAGQVFDFDSSDIHRVKHSGSAPAVTLHAYSPRLRRMGAYAVTRDGALQRHPLAYGEELRPLEPAS